MIPKYTGTWDRGSIWRGDTLLGFSMRIVDKDTALAVVPAEVCAHIVDPFGRKKALAEAVAVDVKALDSGKADKVHTHTPAEVGLGEVDNTSDEDKPMSRAQRAAMAAKFNKGDVAQEVGTNSSKVMSQKASTEAFYRAGSGKLGSLSLCRRTYA